MLKMSSVNAALRKLGLILIFLSSSLTIKLKNLVYFYDLNYVRCNIILKFHVQNSQCAFQNKQVSISSTLYSRVFSTNIISAAFSSYTHIVKAAEMYVHTKNLYVER